MQAQLPEAATQSVRVGVWSLRRYPAVASTNLLAAGLPPWSAIRSDTQTAGRGRFDRGWISDEGGLWLSAVLPVVAGSPAHRIMPLAAGLAVCDALRALGVDDLRMRWPNDLLVGRRKLAGLLLDQFSPDRVVAGVGINVLNHPESHDSSLAGQTTRLADLLSPAPDIESLTCRVLASLRSVWEQLETAGPPGLLPRINALWQGPRRVDLDLDRGSAQGEFLGVDLHGRLELRRAGAANLFLEAREVKHLREFDSILT